ncbi:MAG TPA: AAA family ATPase [Noviherbaspirillum sp.]|nr:AAA family ATPase [Noviherbaspirillum sp.]
MHTNSDQVQLQAEVARQMAMFDDPVTEEPGGFLPPDGPYMELFEFGELERKNKEIELRKTNTEMSEELVKLGQHMQESGPYRRLAMPDPFALEQLEWAFPNFGEVFEYINTMSRLAELNDCINSRVPDFQPMLLVGPPGTGKSYVAGQIANALRTECHTLQMNTAQSNSALSGSSSFWSNHQPGLVFRSLFYGQFGNPLLVLEELDKTGTGQEYNPGASLYQLLEKETAREFSDLCYEWFAIDASRVTYVCTANDLDTIPAPLQTRLKIFQIDAPVDEQSARIISNIFADLLRKQSSQLAGMDLDDRVIEMLIGQSPRIVRNTLLEGIGRSVCKGKLDQLAPDCIRLPGTHQPGKRRIGFTF